MTTIAMPARSRGRTSGGGGAAARTSSPMVSTARDGWNDFDSVTVREPAVPRMIQQHLVVHGKVEHGVVELLAETGNPAIEHVDERRDRRHGSLTVRVSDAPTRSAAGRRTRRM